MQLYIYIYAINSLPNDKILALSKLRAFAVALSKLRAFADDKINVTQKLKFILGREENIVGKGENAGYQHFLLYSPYFQ